MSAVQELAEDTVDTATDFVGDAADVVGDVAEDVGDAVEGVADFVVDDIVEPIGEAVINTIDYALENPVDAAIMVYAASTGQWWAVPAATAAITVAHGGSVEDAAKAAAIAYVTQEFMTGTEVGKDIGAYTKATGAEAGAATGAEASTAAIVSKGVTSSLNGAIVGGLKSVLTGQDIGSGITQGAIAGGSYGATDQYFQNLYKEGALNFTDDPKLNQKIAKSMGTASGAALGAALTNKDPATAVGNYLAYKMMDVANTEIASAAKSTYKSMKDSFASVEEKQKDLLARQESYNKQFADLDKRSDDYNSHVVDYQNKITTEWQPIQAQLDAQKNAYDSALAKYKEQEAIYNNTSLPVETRNAAAKEMGIYAQQTADASKAYDKVFDANKGLYDDLQATGNQLSSTKKTLDSDFAALQGGEGAQLTAAKNSFDKTVADYNATRAAAEEANQKYETQIAEAVTRDIAIDAINNGLVAPVKTNADGSVEFENGITLRPDGSMYQGDNQLFTTVNDVKQNELKFANEQGKNYWFDDSANRLASDTDIQDVYKNNYGLDITKDEAMKFAGKAYDEADNDEVKDYAIDKIGSEFEKYGYKAPDEDTLSSYLQKNGDTLAKVDEVIDPYYVEEQEAKDFVRNTLGREATPEEIAMLSGAKAESSALGTQSAEQAKMYDTLVSLFGAADKAGYGFGTDVAGPDSLAGALPAKVFASEAGMPLSGETATPFSEGPDGTFSRTVTGKTSDGKEYSYDIVYDPQAKAGKQLFYQVSSGMISPEEAPQSGGTSISLSRPEFAEGEPQAGIYTPEKTESELYNESALKMFIDSMSGAKPTTSPSDTSTKTLVDFPPTTTTTGTNAGTGSGSGTTTAPTTGGGTSGTTGAGTGAGTTAGTGAGANAGTGAGTGTGSGTGTGAGGTGTGTGAGGTGTGGTGTGTGGSSSAGSFGDLSSYMTGALMLGAMPGATSAITPLKPSVLTSKDPGTKFEGALQQFQEFASKPFYDENTYADQFAQPQQTPQEEPQFMNTPYYNYGEIDSIDEILSPQTDEQQTQYAAHGGLMTTPLMAAGGITGTRHGQYAHGGLSTPIVHHSGKARVDFRHGDAVTGAGDGQSDDIPAMLADGEFVFPADVVAAIGNGSTKAGSDKLYDMMHGIRAHVRSAKPKDLPPEIKSPLDFLKTKPKKARR